VSCACAVGAVGALFESGAHSRRCSRCEHKHNALSAQERVQCIVWWLEWHGTNGNLRANCADKHG